MTKPVVTREIVKTAIRQLLIEEPNFIFEVLKEARAEQLKTDSPERDAIIDTLIEEDFIRYDKVFKALA